MSERIDTLLAELTLDEKAALTAGSDAWHTAPIARLGIPRMKFSDGPIGVRGGGVDALLGGASDVTSACFPNATCLAASFDPDLLEEVGRALAQEAKTKGVHVVLGPTVNLHRSPLGGRHFECYSEDPHLTARLATGLVRGVQGEGVAACVKHFVCNDSEFERMSISSEVSERALREIYLQPFEAAVREAGTRTIMSAYNRVNGTFATEHRELLVDVLKREWGFTGLVVSDWFAIKDTRGAGNGGNDLEMPGPPRHFGPALADAVRSGSVDAGELDDKVRRILGVMEWTGALDATGEPEERSVDRAEHRALARRAAAAGCVLLTNRRAVLPLADTADLRVALVGPNAAQTSAQGGGSARVAPHYTVAVLQAFEQRAQARGFSLVHEAGCTSFRQLPLLGAEALRAADGSAGMDCDYFGSESLEGDPGHHDTLANPGHTWRGPISDTIDLGSFSARLTATFTPGVSGLHRFSLQAAGRARLRIDGREVIDNWTAPVPGDSWFGFGSQEEVAEVALTAGRPVALALEYSTGGARAFRGFRLGHCEPVPPDGLERACDAARHADVAVVVVGLNADWETEGHDKTDMALPGEQAELVRRIAAVNRRTIVVLNAGAPVEMEWADDVAAVLVAGYGGQEAGHAVVDVLMGEADPGGRLATTIPVRLDDVACHTGDTAVYPGANGVVRYAEDLHVGHRHYDASSIRPRFAFGHGLSYTRFAIDGFEIPSQVDAGQPLRLGVTVRNVGARAGLEVVQVYLADLECRLPRPPRELAAFGKVRLDPGEARKLTLEIAPRAMGFWDPETRDFRIEPGSFELGIGRSSDEIVHRARFEVVG